MKPGIHYAIYVNLYHVLAAGNWIPYRTSRDLALDSSNETEVVNATVKRSRPDQFWLLRDDNVTEETTPILSDTAVTEIVPMETTESSVMEPSAMAEPPKPIFADDPEWMKEYEMNELLFLSRNNCNLELQINEWEDRKLKIQYETLKTGMTGQCRITLRGKTGIFLAILVSNVRLNGNEPRQLSSSPIEVLRMVVRSNHFDYTLREYRGHEEYYPVMLTESDLVYLILHFNGSYPIRGRSSYNLEVFNYYKNANNLNGAMQSDGYHGYGNSSQNVDDIFITTSAPIFKSHNPRPNKSIN